MFRLSSLFVAMEQFKKIAADKEMDATADELHLNMAQACLIGNSIAKSFL